MLDNEVNLANGIGIRLNQSDLATVDDNNISEPTNGIVISNSASVTIQLNDIDNPANTGIGLSGDEGSTISENQITNNNSRGIHYMDGISANLSTNTVMSVGAGVGIRLGTDTSPACANIAIDDVLLENNVLTGGTTDLEVLCDVGTYTVVP